MDLHVDLCADAAPWSPAAPPASGRAISEAFIAIGAAVAIAYRSSANLTARAPDTPALDPRGDADQPPAGPGHQSASAPTGCGPRDRVSSGHVCKDSPAPGRSPPSYSIADPVRTGSRLLVVTSATRYGRRQRHRRFPMRTPPQRHRPLLGYGRRSGGPVHIGDALVSRPARYDEDSPRSDRCRRCRP